MDAPQNNLGEKQQTRAYKIDSVQLEIKKTTTTNYN